MMRGDNNPAKEHSPFLNPPRVPEKYLLYRTGFLLRHIVFKLWSLKIVVKIKLNKPFQYHPLNFNIWRVNIYSKMHKNVGFYYNE